MFYLEKGTESVIRLFLLSPKVETSLASIKGLHHQWNNVKIWDGVHITKNKTIYGSMVLGAILWL